MNEAASADLAPPERLHPLMLLTGLGGSLRGVAGGYAGIGYLAATGNIRTAIIAGTLLLLGLVVSLVLYWRRFEYRVGSHEIRIDSGIFSRTHRSIPFDRVQDVDITQGPLARLLGLAKVKFETGGSAGAGNEDGVLPAIALARAEALREHVRSRRGLAAVTPETGEVAAPLYAMDLRRLLTAGMFNFSLAVFAGLFGVTQTMGDVIGFDPFERAFWEGLLSSAGPLTQFVETHRMGAAIAGLLFLGVLGLLTGIIRTVARDFRFRLERTGTGLRRRRGLLTLTDVTLPLRRVQAALILTGPVRDRFGWRELKFQSLAKDEQGSGDHVVAPLASEEEVETILDSVGLRTNGGDIRWERVSFAHVTSLALVALPLLILGLLWLLLFLWASALAGSSPEWFFGQSAGALVTILLPALLYPVAVGTRWLAWRRTAFALDDERLLIRTGWWRRRTVLLPLTSVQSVDLSQTVVTRRFGVANLTIGVAGGSGYSGHSIPALPRERAMKLREALLSRFA